MNFSGTTTGAISAVVGIFSNIFSGSELTDADHIYDDAVIMEESQVDKRPYLYAAIAMFVLFFSIVLLIIKK
ncbi:MAG: hypothetical protein GY881_02905 [Gammaproteobacteria bacterium]|nr:hypothetical protein [Gammaproteobacteria bacterium]